MAFVDLNLIAGLAGKTVSGLVLSKTAPLTLEVANGSVTEHQTGTTYTLTTAQNHAFTADATYPTQVFMGIIDNGTTTDLWVDAYVDDGSTVKGDLPSGYALVLEIAWFTIDANETDLDNSTINRRVWV